MIFIISLLYTFVFSSSIINCIESESLIKKTSNNNNNININKNDDENVVFRKLLAEYTWKCPGENHYECPECTTHAVNCITKETSKPRQNNEG